MSNDDVFTDQARVLAELVDLALADDWAEGPVVMALLWQASDDPDDLRLAVKRLESTVEQELRPLADGGSYLAVAHSTVTSDPPTELLGSTTALPVRITVAVDHRSDSGVLRHRTGATESFRSVDLPVTRFVRSQLWFQPAA